MTVRAKFRVGFVRFDSEGKATGFSMHPVYAETEENKAFFQATPAGIIDMHITRPEVAAQFAVGKEFYVDFTEAN